MHLFLENKNLNIHAFYNIYNILHVIETEVNLRKLSIIFEANRSSGS